MVFNWALASYYTMHNHSWCQGISTILGNPYQGDRWKYGLIIKVNRTTMIPCYTCLKTQILLLVQTFNGTPSWSTRKAHRLDMIIKHHTSIHTIIHEANNRTKLEQYTKHMKQQVKRFLKMFYTLLRSHRREKHSNRSYNEEVMN